VQKLINVTVMSVNCMSYARFYNLMNPKKKIFSFGHNLKMYFSEKSYENAVTITRKPSWLVFKRLQFRFLARKLVFLTESFRVHPNVF
jgi:hypothetical protein